MMKAAVAWLAMVTQCLNNERKGWGDVNSLLVRSMVATRRCSYA